MASSFVRIVRVLSVRLKLILLIALTFNDIHSGQAGNFSPDKGGEGAVDIYWSVSSFGEYST